jgi:hypothetical protein
VTEECEFKLLKTEFVPRLHTMCLKTTAAGVRVNSLVALSKVVGRLDKDECEKIVDTVTKVGAQPPVHISCEALPSGGG